MTTARARILAWLTGVERIAPVAGTCASVVPADVDHAQTLAIARCVAVHQMIESKPEQFRQERSPGYIEYAFDSGRDARYLVLPGLAASQDVIVVLTDDPAHWRGGQNFRWLRSPRTDAAIDLNRLTQWSGIAPARIRVKLTSPGELALTGPPRLLR